jgi:hypothetical protein
MSPEHLLYPAIFIFSMMVIGLVFTVIEFTKMGVKSDIKAADAQKKRDARARSDESTAKDE